MANLDNGKIKRASIISALCYLAYPTARCFKRLNGNNENNTFVPYVSHTASRFRLYFHGNENNSALRG